MAAYIIYYKKVLASALSLWIILKQCDINFPNEGKKNDLPWIKELGTFLSNNGIGNIEMQLGNLKEGYIKSKIKQRLQDQYVQNYESYLHANFETGKTQMLENCHDHHYRKSYYLGTIQNPDIRTILTKLRIDSNKLQDIVDLWVMGIYGDLSCMVYLY